MSSVKIDGDLLLRRALLNDSVRLEDAGIGGKLDMRRSIFKDRFRMNTVSIRGDLLMQKAQFDKPVELAPLTVGSKLDMRAVTLSELDLTGAQIKGELRLGTLGDKNTTWKSNMDRNRKSHSPKLTLRNATVGTIRDDKDARPPSLELEGFTYQRFGKAGRSMFGMRDSDWFVGWLAMDKTYSPQPYRHLASHIRAAGHGEMVDDILFASRERERSLYNPWQSKWWGLLALKIGINYGYGLGYFLLLRFIVLFVAIGTVVLHIAGERKRHHYMIASFWDSTFYSLDMLLPLIRLRERHYTEVDLNRGARYYFYFHQVVGYLLVSILLAELIG